MPKKGKGKKSGGKGKKGKKSKKAKEKEEEAVKTGIHNSNLWEARLNMMELSRKHYRDIAGNLANENEAMRDHMRETEKDTIDVVTFLKKQDVDKDVELDRLQERVKQMKMEHRQMKDELINNFIREKRQMEDKIARKESELEMNRHELNQVKDFQKKKTQMQKELEEIKEAISWNEREHKLMLDKIEQKSFEEKMRLQQESNQKIQEIASRAQDEALKSLNETTGHVYQENTSLIETLRQNKQQLDELKRMEQELNRQIASQGNEKELNEILIKEKLEQIQKQNHTIKQLKTKIRLLETSLTQFIREFELERKNLLEQARIEHESTREQIIKLQRTLEFKTKEMNEVRKLGKTLIEHRSQLEAFFLDALNYVKKQIALNRLQYRKEAFSAYQNRMLVAHHGQGEYPRIRTFNAALNENSTNSVFQDLEEATRWTNLGPDADFSDLTWEQKEQVLRTLFIQMNSRQARKKVPSIENTPSNDEQNKIFLTQTANTTDIDSSSDSRSHSNSSGLAKLAEITGAVPT